MSAHIAYERITNDTSDINDTTATTATNQS